jgi:hypothetical protein
MFHKLDCYLDHDMSLYNLIWASHVPKLDKVLGRLHKNGFSINPLKCEWGVLQERDFLGYWMTPTSLKPWLKCIEPSLALSKPETLKQIHGFIAMGNFYHMLWLHHANIMAPAVDQANQN